MQKKSKFRWLDAQIVIAALAVTASLALWNVFAAAARHPVLGPISIRLSERLFKNTPTAVAAASATAAPTQMATPGLTQIHLPPLHLLLGGHAPVVQVVVVSNSGGSTGGSPASSVSGGGGGGTVSVPPPPVTTTGSSHP
jgi:hypothetical protein